MAHNYLQLSLDVVRALVGPENAQLLQLNASQCGALKTKLLETATSLQDFVDALSPIDRRLYETSCKTALQEFYRVVKDAEAIIQSCCDKNWLQAAIKLANNTEAFVDVIFKLDWCTAVLGNLSRDVIPGEWNLPKYRATLIGEVDRVVMMGEIERMLTVDAMDDCENLRRRLGELQNGTEALDLRQDIILHLLRITDPAAEDERETEKGDFLLTIEPKELRRMQCIGEGAVAVVHKISWLGQSFAGKYYKRPSYLQERKILADLSHPHVTQVFGCTISDPCCLVMELMHTDLLKHIECFSTSMSSNREALFELPVAVDIMLQIAEGMEYLHRKGIVHRDLNPTNILVNPVSIPEMADAGYVQAKVADFSSAIASTSCLAENHVPETCSLRECFSELEHVGTTPWMAPELGNYESSWGNPFKTDVYSFAITCSEILTGKVPFGSIRRSEVRACIKDGMRPTLPDYIPTSLSSLIECCWDTDARMRPPFSEICAKLRHVKYLLMSDAVTCKKWEQGQLGVHMSRKVGAHEKPVGESPIITLGWRVAYEDNALEFFFQSADSMSSIVGVGLKFGKVVVSASNLEVKIIDIGKETWEAELSTFTALDNMLEVVSIDPAEMIGARSHKNSINELLTGKESAEQYGVGLLSGNTVQSTDVPDDSDYCLVLHKIVEYLMLKKVDLAKIGKQCVGNGGAGSSSSGGRSPNQGNDGGSLSGMHADLTSQFRNSQSNANNDGGDADLSKNQREKLAVDRANTKECKITVYASPKASFFDGEFQLPDAPTEVLNEAAIKPTLEFNFVINSNGSKRIWVETSVAFELGSAAPRSPALNGEFGWYQDDMMFYLEGSKHASLVTSSCVLKTDDSGEAPKATLKLIDTDANNFARERDASLTLGANMLVPTITTSATVKQINTTGKTSAKERSFESCAPEVWGFQHQNLSSSVKSKACHVLSHAPLGVSVLRDGPERQHCIGSGLSQLIIPKFVAEWRIQESDNVEDTYTFGAERWLKKLVKLQDSTREGSGEIHRCSWRQEYKLPMVVNHTMDHLCNVKGHVVLRENEYVPEVLHVGRAM